MLECSVVQVIELGLHTQFVGRIMERHQHHGLLNLGGTVLLAKLPEGVEAGNGVAPGRPQLGDQGRCPLGVRLQVEKRAKRSLLSCWSMKRTIKSQ